MLDIGSVQKMNLCEHDVGPFWVKSIKKNATKYEVVETGIITKEEIKAELLIELHKNGVDTTSWRFLLKELKELAVFNNTTTSITTNNVSKGWRNTPKGMLQILCERGFIDTTLVKTARSSRYSILGKKITSML